jgi:hypothetical protein
MNESEHYNKCLKNLKNCKRCLKFQEDGRK